MSAATVVYLPVAGIDTSAGRRMIEGAGLQVLDLPHPRAAISPSSAASVLGLMVGYDDVDGAAMDRFPSLRVIATHSAGVDMVDVEAARQRGIWVCNVPAAATEEVASHALAMLLALVRRLPRVDAALRAGGWPEVLDPPPSRLSELRLGLVGLGRIGRELVRIAAPIFGAVQAYDPLVPQEDWPHGVARLPLDEVISSSECLSLHVPLVDSTRGLLDAARIASMPHGAVLVNVARGELVDQGAVLQALQEGRLSGVGLDVFANEPPAPDDPVRSASPALLSPHTAFLSTRTLHEYAVVPADAVRRVLTGRIPDAVVVRGR